MGEKIKENMHVYIQLFHASYVAAHTIDTQDELWGLN